MNQNLVQSDRYVAGWLNSSIRDLFEAYSFRGASTRFSLVTCLDSDSKPGSLLGTSPHLKSVINHARQVGSAFLLPTKHLLRAHSDGPFFFGFDEVWFFPGADIEPKPGSASLVGPARVGQDEMDELGDWMKRNSCSLGLGDGEGLNFVVKAHGLTRHLLGHSLNQPRVASVPYAAAESA